MRPSIFVCLLALVFAAGTAVAQYTIDKIDIHNGAPYADAELLEVTGLHTGEQLNQDNLKHAAQSLLDIGIFDDTQAIPMGSGAHRTINFILKPTPLAKMMPASFANFVWFAPEELDAAIHARVGLYRGRLPDAGNLPDRVQNALEQILAAKGITATISHAIIEPTTAHPQRVVDFRIDTPTVRVQSATLTGIAAPQAAAVQRITAQLPGTPYNEGLNGDTIADRILAPLRDAGFITAAVDSVQRQPLASLLGILVAYSAHVQQGDAYRVSSLTWNATPLFGADDFVRGARLHIGDVASDAALKSTEQPVIAAYHSKGYIDAFIESGQQLDGNAHTVAYSLTVHPGDQYHLHTLNAQNLSAEARRDFDAGWLIKPGDVYDAEYVANFLRNNTALLHLAGYAASFEAVADPQTHGVDLTINFVQTRR